MAESDNMLGQHEAKIENLERVIEKMGQDVHAMRTAMDELRGAWKLAIWISGVLGAVLALVINHFWGPK